MTKLHHVTLHTFQDSQLPLPTSDQLERQQQIAQSLCHPTTKPFKTHTIDTWTKQDPIHPIPNTRSYSTTVPSTLSPSKRLRSKSPSPSIVDWQSLSSFKHWNPSPSPPPLLPPIAHPGILRKRTIDGKPTVGAWSTSTLTSGGGGEGKGEEVERKGKKKKTVRMESPASTAVGDSSRMSTRKSPRRSGVTIGTSEGDASLRRSSRGRAKSAKELVPATPDEGGRAGDGEGGQRKEPPVSITKERREQPELGIGSIKRCIPPPYHHLISHTSLPPPDPTRQVPSRILHSFVDPIISPSSYPPTTSSREVPPDLCLLSPLTASYLTPGRQGSWLIPISSPFPLLHSSPPLWFAIPPPPLPRPSNSTLPLPLPIEWTDSRLKALWAFLTHFHSTSSCGRLRASCIVPPSSTSTSKSDLPGYVKITMDANLALPFRTLLSLFSVAKAFGLGSTSGREWSRGLGEEVKKDKERWLKGRGLAWVDEMGRAILVA